MNTHIKLIFVFTCLSLIACKEKEQHLVVPESVIKTLKSCVILEEKYANKTQYSENELKDMQVIQKQCSDEKLNYIKSNDSDSIGEVNY